MLGQIDEEPELNWEHEGYRTTEGTSSSPQNFWLPLSSRQVSEKLLVCLFNPYSMQLHLCYVEKGCLQDKAFERQVYQKGKAIKERYLLPLPYCPNCSIFKVHLARVGAGRYTAVKHFNQVSSYLLRIVLVQYCAVRCCLIRHRFLDTKSYLKSCAPPDERKYHTVQNGTVQYASCFVLRTIYHMHQSLNLPFQNSLPITSQYFRKCCILFCEKSTQSLDSSCTTVEYPGAQCL